MRYLPSFFRLPSFRQSPHPSMGLTGSLCFLLLLFTPLFGQMTDPPIIHSVEEEPPGLPEIVSPPSINNPQPLENSSLELKEDAKTTEEKNTPSPLPIEEVELFVEILEQLQQEYVDPVSDKELLHNAIKGMLTELDPHSTFFNEEEFQETKEQTLGEFAGLGVEVIPDNGFIKVIAPIDDSPAQKAGIKAGDQIIQIDDKSVLSMDPDSAIKLLRGEIGSEITLKILREGTSRPLTFELVRDIIKTKSIKYEIYHDSILYLRLSQFQQGSEAEVKKAIQEARERIESRSNHLKGMILDLRNNPGGLLDEAITIADLFIHEGVITYTEGRIDEAKKSFHATPGDILNKSPMIVLINSGSASASEILAGALQDQKRALIVGEKSFGKGSVQTVIDLANGKGLKYTIARYYTPKGTSIQATGIIPDVLVAPATVKLEKELLSIREKDMKGHLENNEELSKTKALPYVDNSQYAEEDYYLYEALNILQALILLQ